MKITKLYPPKYNGFVTDLPIKAQTLFGAFANNYVELFEEESFEKFIKLFDSGKISSAFPAIKINDKEILFLPKPYLRKLKTDNEQEDNLNSKKKLKKIRWVSFEAMKLLSNSITKQGDEFFHSVDFNKDFSLIGNEFLILPSELDSALIDFLSNVNFYQQKSTIRVSMPRFGDDSQPFDQEELCLAYYKMTNHSDMKIVEIQTFLYFFEEIQENSIFEAIKALLCDNGIGGKRNLGKGYFQRIETVELTYFDNINPKCYLLVSSIFPKKEELPFIKQYDINIDDGFITMNFATTLKKDEVFLIKEGAIIENKINGKILSQNWNNKTLYRYGKAFLLPLGGSNE